jgi:hypothetical protein
MGYAVVQWQIVTKDPERLAQFYSKLCGWKINTDNALNYRAVDTGAGRGIQGGIWPAPPEASSFAQLFIEVDDINAVVKKAGELGARVLIPPQQLPDGDKLAILHDPMGVPFGVYAAAAKSA